MTIHNVPTPLYPYVSRTADEQLVGKLLESNETACIEITGPIGTGKTTLVQQLVNQHLDNKSYELIAWIDCSSVTRAHADLLTLSQKLGNATQDPQAATRQLIDYCQQQPRHLLILDALDPDILPLMKETLKSLKGQLIYTASHSLIDTFTLGRRVNPVNLSPFQPLQAQQLVSQCLPEEALDADDYSTLIALTDGRPAVIQALCRHYAASIRYRNFADFLAQPNLQQSMLDTLSDITQASILPIEKAAPSDPAMARALTILKQAIWLGNQSIPFEFFMDDNQNTDYEAIDKLHHQKLALLTLDRETQSLRLIQAFRGALQKRYQAEQIQLISKNIERLSQVFSYLTDNDSANGRQSQAKNLTPYTDLVHSLLFETYKPGMLPQGSPRLGQLLALGSSLGRLYYLYHGELQLAHDSLQKAITFFKDGLSKALIAQFQQEPDKGCTIPSVSEAEAYLLTLYGQEYLYQIATLSSQLIPRGQVAPKVIQDFEKAYAIQRHVKAAPESIAYTLRNLTRALRKQGPLETALQWYNKLKIWIAQHPLDALQTANLLIDEGIIKKELEDNKAVEYRQYQDAIGTLLETHHVYKVHNTAGQCHGRLGTLSLYLGEAYLAAGQFESGITHTYQILHYDGAVRWKQARVYFNLAKAFHEAGYKALAKYYVDKAYPLQIATYKFHTEKLRLDIEQALLDLHRQPLAIQSSPPEVLQDDRTVIETYCEQLLLEGSQPQKNLSRDQIQQSNQPLYAWLRRQHSASARQAQQAEIDQQKKALEAKESEQIEQRNLQQAQQALWYREFDQRIRLDDPNHRKTKFFAKQFEIALLTQITQRVRLVNGETLPMDKADLAAGLINALSNVLPTLGVSMGMVIAIFDLSVVLQGITQTLADRHHRAQQADAPRALALYQDPESTESIQAVGRRIQQQVQEMAHYAARCYQPLLSGRLGESLTEDGIKTLTDCGARRIIEHTHVARLETPSYRELVMLALMTGQATLKLKSPKISGNGFFAKPGVKVAAKDNTASFYVTSQSHPNRYGFRWGSPAEVQHGLYRGPFNSESAAETEASAKQPSHCSVM